MDLSVTLAKSHDTGGHPSTFGAPITRPIFLGCQSVDLDDFKQNGKARVNIYERSEWITSDHNARYRHAKRKAPRSLFPGGRLGI